MFDFIKNIFKKEQPIIECKPSGDYNRSHIYEYTHKFFWQVMSQSNPEETYEYQIMYPGKWEIILNDKQYNQIQICRRFDTPSEFSTLRFSWDKNKYDVVITISRWDEEHVGDEQSFVYEHIDNVTLNVICHYLRINFEDNNIIRNIICNVVCIMRHIYCFKPDETFLLDSEKQRLVSLCEMIFLDLTRYTNEDVTSYMYNPNKILNKLVNDIENSLKNEYDSLHDCIYDYNDKSKIDWEVVRNYLHSIIDTKLDSMKQLYGQPNWASDYKSDIEIFSEITEE